MKLYELAQAYQELMDNLDNLPEDAIADTLEAIAGEFDQKIDSIASICKQLKGEAELLKNEEKALEERRKAKEAQIERLTSYALMQMLAAKRTKIETAHNVVTVAKTPARVELDADFIRWAEQYAEDLLSKPKPREANKTAIKKAIQNGENVEHAHLEEGQALRIK